MRSRPGQGREQPAPLVSQEFLVAQMYAHNRTLRLADGPDEVHRSQIAKLELRKYQHR